MSKPVLNEEAIGMILIVISIIFLISIIITYLVNNVWFRGLYTKYFYRKPYDLVFYKYNLVVIDLVSITLYALTLFAGPSHKKGKKYKDIYHQVSQIFTVIIDNVKFINL